MPIDYFYCTEEPAPVPSLLLCAPPQFVNPQVALSAINQLHPPVLSPRRIDYEHWEEWMKANLKASDAIF